MPVSLLHIQNELLAAYAITQKAIIDNLYEDPLQWERVFAPAPGAPHIWIPLPLVATGAASAVIVKNPEVTRRFWRGWVSH